VSTGFEFVTAARVVFGAGAAKGVGVLAKEFGIRALVVTGSQPGRAEVIFTSLRQEDISTATVSVKGEPTLALVHSIAALAKQEQCDVLIAVGGGSVIDATKAAAGWLANGGELLDYIEVIGRAQPLRKPALPWIAIPTTAGAGAEVTRNAVLTSPEHRFKASIRSSHLLTRIALVDPELALSLPPAVTASTGMDALTQLIEPYVSHRANPVTDALCVDGMKRATRSLRRAFDCGSDLAARGEMALASLYSGMALANAGLGAVHGFAAPIGGMFPAPHGAVCAALLPAVMETNLRALRERAPQSESLRRYDEIGRLLTGKPQATSTDALAWVRETCAHLSIPPLRQYGITEADFPALVEKASVASSMKANPVTLTQLELRETLTNSL
jgi:alcohol dehydrogenase class IV